MGVDGMNVQSGRHDTGVPVWNDKYSAVGTASSGLTCVPIKNITGPVLMSPQTDTEHELAEILVESLNLEDIAAGEIDPEAPLFNTGLGLDSIDALELSLAISKRYGFQLRSDNEENQRIFASLRALTAHVQQHKTV